MWNPSRGISIRQTSGVILCAIVCGGLAIVGARGGAEQAPPAPSPR